MLFHGRPCSAGRIAEILVSTFLGALIFGKFNGFLGFFCNREVQDITPWVDGATSNIQLNDEVLNGGSQLMTSEDQDAYPMSSCFGMSKALRKELHSWKNKSILVHVPHGAAPRISGINKLKEMATSLKKRKCKCPTGLVGVFVWSYPEDKEYSALVRLGYEACGCPYVQLDYGNKKWDWFGKVGPVLHWLEGGGAEGYTHVLVTDAEDVAFVRSPSGLIEKFSKYEADVLFASTMSNWPKNDHLAKFEARVNPWSTRHQHLSAGGYVAKTERLLPYLQLLEEDHQRFVHNKSGTKIYTTNVNGDTVWDDQLEWRRLHRQFYPRVQIDSLSLLFTRLDDSIGVL